MNLAIFYALVTVPENSNIKYSLRVVVFLLLSYLDSNFIYAIMQRKKFTQTFMSALDLAKRLNRVTKFSDLIVEGKRNCSLVFVLYQFYYFFMLLHYLFIDNRIWKISVILYARILINSFIVLFCFATEFLLICLKALRLKLTETLKAESSILQDYSTDNEKASALERLRITIDIASYFYREIALFSLKQEQLFRVTVLSSLLFILLGEVFEVIIYLRRFQFFVV